jgi:hypothetical protein
MGDLLVAVGVVDRFRPYEEAAGVRLDTSTALIDSLSVELL